MCIASGDVRGSRGGLEYEQVGGGAKNAQKNPGATCGINSCTPKGGWSPGLLRETGWQLAWVGFMAEESDPMK